MPEGLILNWLTAADLYPKRKFKISFTGIKTLEANLRNTTKFELFIYYKNTHSIISYSAINMDPVNVVTLVATVHHPEYFNLFDGMWWPFQFNFSSAVDFPNGWFMVIRQRNYDKTLLVVTLVAASCDFSDTNFD